MITLCDTVAARTPDETKALELDNPAAGGIVPQTTAANDLLISSDKFETSNKPPTTPQRKYFHQWGIFSDSISSLLLNKSHVYYVSFSD